MRDMGGPMSRAAVEKPASILVLDDEEGVVSALRSMLRREGYRIHHFTSATSALTLIQEDVVDVIMCDLRMPEMSGIEFLNRAGGFCPNAARIMVSGYEDKEVILNSLAKGLAQHYVMKPWDDTELKSLLARTVRQLRLSEYQRLRDIFGGVESLPAAPHLHQKLCATLARPDVPVQVLVAEIEKNPPVVAKLLQVANSVYYSARKPVTTVREAVQFIGTGYVENLVMVIEAFQHVGGSNDAWAAEKVDQLWHGAIARASIAKAIADEWLDLHGKRSAYVAALLQDIGLVVRVRTDPERFRRFLDLLQTTDMGLLDADRRAFGVPHDEIGAALLRYWNLPESFVDLVARHHRSSGSDDLLTVMQVADALAGGPYVMDPSPALHPVIETWRANLPSAIATR
ncbi:MAG: HDOD domain-containing protein [Bacteroidetes bacterium]|nr:HDOD domain-containing protein [Bacteroidota bacterium]